MILVKASRKYHYRKKSTRPEAVGTSSKSGLKIKIWGGISWRGHVKFVVII